MQVHVSECKRTSQGSGFEVAPTNRPHTPSSQNVPMRDWVPNVESKCESLAPVKVGNLDLLNGKHEGLAFFTQNVELALVNDEPLDHCFRSTEIVRTALRETQLALMSANRWNHDLKSSDLDQFHPLPKHDEIGPGAFHHHRVDAAQRWRSGRCCLSSYGDTSSDETRAREIDSVVPHERNVTRQHIFEHRLYLAMAIWPVCADDDHGDCKESACSNDRDVDPERCFLPDTSNP